MGGIMKKPKPPKVPKPVPMPDEEDTKEAARRRLSELQARSGLNSTLLTDNNSRETLG